MMASLTSIFHNHSYITITTAKSPQLYHTSPHVLDCFGHAAMFDHTLSTRASLGDSEDDEDDEVIDIQPFVRPRQGGVCAEPWEQGYYKERRPVGMVMGGIWWDDVGRIILEKVGPGRPGVFCDVVTVCRLRAANLNKCKWNPHCFGSCMKSTSRLQQGRLRGS